jgi:hypothetical protein
MHRLVIGVASTALVLGAVAAPAAAIAADPLDDGRGIVVGVEIVPRSECVGDCGSVPTTEPSQRRGLADTGADIAPTLMVALGLGASGLAIAGVAGVVRARAGRAHN